MSAKIRAGSGRGRANSIEQRRVRDAPSVSEKHVRLGRGAPSIVSGRIWPARQISPDHVRSQALGYRRAVVIGGIVNDNEGVTLAQLLCDGRNTLRKEVRRVANWYDDCQRFDWIFLDHDLPAPRGRRAWNSTQTR